MPIAKSPFEQNVIDDVAEHGFSIMNILNSVDDDGGRPEFSYTIGLFANFKHPEIILFGLRKIRAGVMSSLGKDVKSGKVFEAGKQYADIVADYECTFRRVAPDRYPEYLGFAMWYYDYKEFPAIQCIWPDKKQMFPWQPEFDQRCSWEQELLFLSGESSEDS